MHEDTGGRIAMIVMKETPALGTTDDEIGFLSAVELAAAYRARALSPVEVTESILRRIERVNPAINAFVTVTSDIALEAAKQSECAFRTGTIRGPLEGIPLGVKDLSLTKGVRTTMGSRVYEHFVPDEDAPIPARLFASGAVMLGKTNSPEFGWKSPTDNPLFGPTRNPWNTALTSAGSSGGSGAAVATGLGPIATGGDGGGSIRQPASFCGVVGLKPTFGLVPMYPPSPVGSFVSEGPMSRTVRDSALMLNVIAGHDERDAFSAPNLGIDYLAACDGDLRGLRVAWSPDLGYAAVDPAVREIASAAASRFTELGATVEEANPGWPDPAELFHTLFYGLIGAEIAALLPEWSGKLDPGLERLAELGAPLTAFEVARATQRRVEMQVAMAHFFKTYDLLLTPTMTLPPFPVGIDFPAEVGGTPVQGMQWTAFTFPFNLTGNPAASVPAGWTADGLPIGLQIVGRRWEDALVLRACAGLESISPWAHRRPPFSIEKDA
jgi:aspartyl-tRNA(Asn)/glutamyl-tRNA(Gln) amidotransferase subunit A